MGKRALVIVDVQAGLFVPPRPVHAGKPLLKTLAGIIRRARKAGVPVIYIQHCGRPGTKLEKGGPGWSIHPDIAPAPGETVIEKREPDSFQGTRLGALLRKRGIETLIIGGVLTECCVDTTTRSAFSRGYQVTLLADGHSSSGNWVLTGAKVVAHHNEALRRFADVRRASQVRFGR